MKLLNEKKMQKDEKGITLIALIVTIIVLAILVGVSLSVLVGDQGIIRKTQSTSEDAEKESVREQALIDISSWVYDEVTSKRDGIVNTPEQVKQILESENSGKKKYYKGFTDEGIETPNGYIVPYEELYNSTLDTGVKPGKPDENGLFTEKSTINGETTSSKNNPLIPVGFKPVDQGKAVWGNGTTAPAQSSVQAGLVIEDVEGNQYVWIAVDGVMQQVEGDGGKRLQDAVDGEIVLGRYVFKDDGTIDTTANVTPTTLGGSLKDKASLQYEYTEKLTELSGFINSVRNNGGYYIARYEASYGADGKANSKVSNGYIENDGEEYAPTGEEREGYLWNNISKASASNACQNLYGENINSSLLNSYAWDTAILFIQKYSGNTKYSREIGTSATNKLNNTGKNKLASTNKEDIVCNIYDMAGNCKEWTTEMINFLDGLYSIRGGAFLSGKDMTSYRVGGTPTGHVDYTFRLILYL